MTTPALDTHDLTIDVGKHAGERFTRLPVSYLRWMVSVRHAMAHIAQAELDRRGTVTPDLDVSGHAVDRASQCALPCWQSTREGDEGLHAWLCRIAAEALKNPPRRPGEWTWGPLLLKFDTDTVWPVLKTVIYCPRKALKAGGSTHE